MRASGSRILVVDDDAAMLRTVERILSPAHAVRGFPSGDQALAAIREEPYDVAIVDVRMPGMDGFDLTRAIKATRPRTEVILVTGSVTDLDDKLIRSVKERAGFFITKPFSKAVLTSLVERCLELQRLEEERDRLIERMTEDLTRARRFQQALQPKGLPRSFGPILAAAAHVTCEAVGGDIYDVSQLPEDRVLLLVADVVGHGVAAALVTGMLKTAVTTALEDDAALAPMARAAIDSLAPLGPHRVVTMFLGLVDARRRRLDYLNAGHPPGILWGHGREPLALGATTPLLAYGIEMTSKPVSSVPFGPGDRLALYSDGLYELRDPSGNEFGRDRLTQSLVRYRGSIVDLVERTMERTRKHAGGRPPDDDLTLLLIEFRPA